MAPGARPRAQSGAVLLEPGSFDVNSLIVPEECLGLLVLDGLIAAKLEVGRARVAWLLGANDLIRPREMGELALTRRSRWQALTLATVTPVADISWQPPTPNPAIVQQLLTRAANTSHWLLATSLILSAPSIEERLLLLFAHYAERWGKVTPRGVRLDLPLTHELIASLAGAQRPTVTIALRSLTQQGLLTRVSREGWLLARDPKTNGSRRCWTHYADLLGLDGRTIQEGASERAGRTHERREPHPSDGEHMRTPPSPSRPSPPPNGRPQTWRATKARQDPLPVTAGSR